MKCDRCKDKGYISVYALTSTFETPILCGCQKVIRDTVIQNFILEENEPECEAGIEMGCGACKVCDPEWWDRLYVKHRRINFEKVYIAGDWTPES